ncbi:carbon monoxide dehydrogenase [Ktedonobacteria bacterium brp13]|nr:carbon monoxide dehydrogenase [Ktedonobacteria bacterium brp13]
MSVPAVFDYHAVNSVDEAIALLQQYGDEAKILSGGHSLIPAMKLRLSQPGHLIDISKLNELSYIRKQKNGIAIGAATTYSALERSELLQQLFPIIPEGTSVIGDQQVRNRGTIGGSIVHNDPAADMPGIVLALKAEIIVQGPKGKRTIAADDFFVDTFTTALTPDELVVEILLPQPSAHTGSAYEKIANKASHYAVAGCAAVISVKNDTCTAASIVITGASVRTTRATTVEQALIGKHIDEQTLADAASHASNGLEMISDIHGSDEYRRQICAVIARRTISKALKRV